MHTFIFRQMSKLSGIFKYLTMKSKVSSICNCWHGSRLVYPAAVTPLGMTTYTYLWYLCFTRVEHHGRVLLLENECISDGPARNDNTMYTKVIVKIM